MSQDRFKQAEDEFFRLKGQLATGRITPQQFEEARQRLTVRDSDGRSYLLSADAGIWQLQGATAPSQSAASAPPEMTPTPPISVSPGGIPPGGIPPSDSPPSADPKRARAKNSRPKSARSESAPLLPSAAPPRRKRSCLGGCLRFFGFLLLILLLAGLIFWFWPQISQVISSFKPGLRAGACKKIVPVVTSETASGDKLLCQFGLTDQVSIEQAASRDAALKQIAVYTQAQRQMLTTLAKTEGFTDRSTWQAESAIYDVRGTLSGAATAGTAAYTREGLLLYRDRYLIRVRLSNWQNEAALNSRWEYVAGNARKLIDAKFK